MPSNVVLLSPVPTCSGIDILGVCVPTVLAVFAMIVATNTIAAYRLQGDAAAAHSLVPILAAPAAMMFVGHSPLMGFARAHPILWAAVIASLFVLAFAAGGRWWLRRVLVGAGVRSRQEVRMPDELSRGERAVRLFLGLARLYAIGLGASVVFLVSFAFQSWMFPSNALAQRVDAPFPYLDGPWWVSIPAWFAVGPFSLVLLVGCLLMLAKVFWEMYQDIAPPAKAYVSKMYRDFRAGVTGEDVE